MNMEERKRRKAELTIDVIHLEITYEEYTEKRHEIEETSSFSRRKYIKRKLQIYEDLLLHAAILIRHIGVDEYMISRTFDADEKYEFLFDDYSDWIEPDIVEQLKISDEFIKPFLRFNWLEQLKESLESKY